MTLLVNTDASVEHVDAVHAVEQFWRCPECGKEFENQDDAIEHHIKNHQESGDV